MVPTATQGIFQSDIVIRTGIVAALEDMRQNPYLLDFVFAFLVNDPLTNQFYGVAELDKAKAWFLSTELPVVMTPLRIDMAKMPCITVELLESSETESTIGDVHYQYSEDAVSQNLGLKPYSSVVFTPKSYTAATGTLILPDALSGQVVFDVGMVVVTANGKQYPIVDTIDDATLLLGAGTVDNFANCTIQAAGPDLGVTLESQRHNEVYRIGCHVTGEPVHLLYLHSILTFVLLRYKQDLFDARGFTHSKISSAEPHLNGSLGKEVVYTRFTQLSGTVTQFWPKRINQKTQAVVVHPVRLTGVSKVPVTPVTPVTALTWQGVNDP